jgi:integrase
MATQERNDGGESTGRWFDAIIDTRAVLKERDEALAMIRKAKQGKGFDTPPAEPSKETCEQYVRNGTRLLTVAKEQHANDVWAALAALGDRTKSKATWRQNKTAVLHTLALSAKKALDKQDQMQKDATALLKRDPTALKVSDPAHPEYDTWAGQVQIARHLARLIETAPDVCPIEDAKRRESKKVSIVGLVRGWREMLLPALPEMWRELALVQICTGCRPAELQNDVEIWEEPGELKVKLNGAKVTQVAGQPTRTLTWKVSDPATVAPLIAQLLELVRSRDGRMLASYQRQGLGDYKDPMQALSDAYTAAGRKLWPKHGETITAYSARHAFAVDGKESGMDDDELSIALGHALDKTKQLYGYIRTRRGGGLAPDKAEGPREVKQTTAARPDWAAVQATGKLRDGVQARPKKASKAMKPKGT